MCDERVVELLHLFANLAHIARCLGMVLSCAEEGQAVTYLSCDPSLDHAMGGLPNT